MFAAFDCFKLVIFFADGQIKPSVPHHRQIEIRNLRAVWRVGVNVINALVFDAVKICRRAFVDFGIFESFFGN